jgi:hypothetical protein
MVKAPHSSSFHLFSTSFILIPSPLCLNTSPEVIREEVLFWGGKCFTKSEVDEDQEKGPSS